MKIEECSERIRKCNNPLEMIDFFESLRTNPFTSWLVGNVLDADEQTPEERGYEQALRAVAGSLWHHYYGIKKPTNRKEQND